MRRGGVLLAAVSLLAFTGALVSAGAARADELKLKDGSKIVGSIVGFEDNSFKVKTSYGYALVQRDQVVSILVSETAAKPEPEKKPEPAAERPTAPAKPARTETAAAAPAAAPAAAVSAPATPVNKASAASAPTKPAKSESANTTAPSSPVAPTSKPIPTAAAASASATATRPSTPATPNAPKTPPAAAATSAAKASAPAAAAPTPAAKPDAPQPVREAVSGNVYMNDTYGFRMYKPPGWDVIEGARTILPGALTALGTSDQRTVLLVGLAPAGETLTNDIDEAEQRLRETLASFRITEQKRMMVSGVSAIAHRFRGSVDAHEWSGVVVFVPLGAHIYTIFGMTYADSDLVQIQENVINRTISSLQFLRN